MKRIIAMKSTENRKVCRAGQTPPADQVIVIGAGASGMMAAIAAARAGAGVRLLEQMKKPGRKLLLTGNGRCNLTNLDPDLPKAYHSVQSAAFADELAESVFSSFDVRQTLGFFETLGLLTQERDGYVYPRSSQAQSVLQVLLGELDRLHVRMKYDTAVTGLEYDRPQELWLVKTPTWIYPARAVVLSCGSKAGIGAAFPDYHLAGMAGHTGVDPWPALTALHCADQDLKLCEGARTKAKVTLIDAGILPYLQDLSAAAGYEKTEIKGMHSPKDRGWGILPKNRAGEDLAASAGLRIACDEGEIQWTASEISGIPVFQLSRFTYGLSAKSPMVVSVDFFPEHKEEWIRSYLRKQFEVNAKGSDLSHILNGLVHERIASYLIYKSELRQKTGLGNRAGLMDEKDKITDPDRAAALFALLFKRLALIVDGTRDFEKAQIVIGGISLAEVDFQTLESLVCPGLFLAGEVLDMDGPCGGYNLQWAWSSGTVAGRSAAGMKHTAK